MHDCDQERENQSYICEKSVQYILILCFVCVHFSQPEYATEQHSVVQIINSILRILKEYKILSVSHF